MARVHWKKIVFVQLLFESTCIHNENTLAIFLWIAVSPHVQTLNTNEEMNERWKQNLSASKKSLAARFNF